MRSDEDDEEAEGREGFADQWSAVGLNAHLTFSVGFVILFRIDWYGTLARFSSIQETLLEVPVIHVHGCP